MTEKTAELIIGAQEWINEITQEQDNGEDHFDHFDDAERVYIKRLVRATQTD